MLWCISCSLSLSSQDSLKIAYYTATGDKQKIEKGINYLEEIRFEDPDLALLICDSLINLEKKRNSITYLGPLYEQAGGAAWHKGELKTSTRFYKLSFLYYYKKGDIAGTAASLNNMAYNYFESGNYTEALQHLSLAQRIGKKLNDEKLLAVTNTYIGQVNIKLKEYDRGIKAYKQSLIYFEKEKKHRNQAIVYNNIGNAFLEQNMHDSALFWFNLSYELNAKTNNQNGLALSLSNRGLAYIEQQNYVGAEEALLSAYKKYDSLKNDLSLVLVSSNLARLYTETNKTNEAIIFAQKAEKLGIDVASYEQLVNVYGSLSKLYGKKNEFEKAFNYSRLQMQFADSLANENSQRIQNEMATRFETETLNDKIELLNNANKLKDAEIEKKKARQNLFIAVAAAALIIITLLFYVLRSKNKTQKELEEKNNIIENALEERGVLLKEIHHRVKNNLQIISSLLSLQGGYGDAVSTEELVKQSESRIKSMALIHEKLYQSESLKEINLAEYLDSFLEQLANLLFFEEKNISYSVEVEKRNLDIDRLVPLGLIMNELITNAVKHGFKNRASGKIQIQGKQEEDFYLLTVTDNGEGMPENFSIDRTNSLGIRLMKGLANQIKSKISIQSTPGNTVFSIRLPV
ncbi:MAG: histidine kinase dimerization/phosphoacceptor domain -containing protein [Bacteroidota bacterium]|nr:histidine kinase dimerization/phosphoacceptor domain -containing protein [Bacteroidota bacterium]